MSFNRVQPRLINNSASRWSVCRVILLLSALFLRPVGAAEGHSNPSEAEGFIPIDTARTYRLSGRFRRVPDAAVGTFLFGLELFDAERRPLQRAFFNPVPMTEAVLLEAARAGDRTLRVSRTAERWSNSLRVAFNAQDDYSDIPNRSLSNFITGIEIADVGYTVTLASPLGDDVPEGTPLRLHRLGNARPSYAAHNASIPAEWTEFSAVLAGVAPILEGEDRLKFLPETRFAKIHIAPRDLVESEDVALAIVDDQEPPPPVTLSPPPTLFLRCERDSALFQCGEEAVFTFHVKQAGDIVRDGVVSITFFDSVNGHLRTEEMELTAGEISVSETMTAPGFLTCRARIRIDDKDYRTHAVAGFDPEAIAPAAPEPDDFMDFWERGLAELNAIPSDVILTEMENHRTPRSTSYTISVANLDGSRTTGFISVPNGPGPFPAIVTVPGAGLGVTRPPVAWAGKGALSVAINVFHDALPLHGPDRARAYAELNRDRWYFLQGVEDRDRYFYRKTILGVWRILDYITQREDWDGEHLVMFGYSQGGGLSLIMTGLHPSITAVAAAMPGLCDFAAPHRPGWPNPGNANAEVRYFDAVNFSRRITVPALLSVGFLDEMCTPSSIYAAYNQLRGPKEIFSGPLSGHGSSIPVAGFSAYMHRWIERHGGLMETPE